MAALGDLMHPDLVMADHRRLGLDDLTKDDLLELWSVGWSDDVALVEHVVGHGGRAVTLQTIFVSGAARMPAPDSRSLSVMAVAAGRVVRIELFDGDAADGARACHEALESTPAD